MEESKNSQQTNGDLKRKEEKQKIKRNTKKEHFCQDKNNKLSCMRKSARNTTSYNILEKTMKIHRRKEKIMEISFCINCVLLQTTHCNAGNTPEIRLLFTAGYYSTGSYLGCLYLI